jgi:hypothetical protein
MKMFLAALFSVSTLTYLTILWIVLLTFTQVSLDFRALDQADQYQLSFICTIIITIMLQTDQLEVLVHM